MMPEVVAEPPSSCYRLFPGLGIQKSQLVGPDLFHLARDARVKGSSGNPCEPVFFL